MGIFVSIPPKKVGRNSREKPSKASKQGASSEVLTKTRARLDSLVLNAMTISQRM